MEKGINLKQVLPRESRESYTSALREFTQMTIADPTFFNKTPEEQRDMAMQMIQKHKKGVNKRFDHQK